MIEQQPQSNKQNNLEHPKLHITKFDSFQIREAELQDAGRIYNAIDEHRNYLRTWLPFVDHLQCIADEEKFLSSTLSVPYEERNLVFIIEKNTIFYGLIGFTITDNTNHKTEIGYWLLPEYQGKGIMTQCVKHLIQWAIKERKMNRIQIRCAVGNAASNAIPQRLGFHFEGVERQGELLATGDYTDIKMYSLCVSDL